MNKLLEILRREGHRLPKDSQTLRKTPRAVAISEKCSGDYMYLGIQNGVILSLKKCPGDIYLTNIVELLVSIDVVVVIVKPRPFHRWHPSI